MTDYRDNTALTDAQKASLAGLATAIRTKMYGKDVREAIASAIETVGTPGVNSYFTPKGVKANLAALKTAYPAGTDGIWITQDDGYWNFWDGTAWEKGMVYQGTILSDGEIIKILKYDIKYLLDWTYGTCLHQAEDGIALTKDTGFGTASIKLPKGAKITAHLKISESTCAMGSGDSTNPISKMGIAGDSDGIVDEIYTVKKSTETLYFQIYKPLWDRLYINVNLTNTSVNENEIGTSWHAGYVGTDGTLNNILGNYWYSDLITLEKFKKLSVKLAGSPDANVVSYYDKTGNFLSGIAGEDAAKEYFALSGKEAYIRLSASFGTKYNLEFGDTVLNLVDYSAIYALPKPAVGAGYIGTDGIVAKVAGNYSYSDIILLQPGQTIEFYSAGSSSVFTLSEWDKQYNFVKGLATGDAQYHISQYTADHLMYVRICARVVKGARNEAYVDQDDFANPKIYFKELYYQQVSSSKLYQKKVIFIGDSLAMGAHMGTDVTWLHRLALKYDWEEHNYGISGNAISTISGATGTAMSVRYQDIANEVSDADIVIVLGGANDKNNNCPIGENSDAGTDTFKGAINVLIDGLRKAYPKAKLLFQNVWNRYAQNNTLGFSEHDYALAMNEVCALKSVPCFDNNQASGITFLDANLQAWCDEGLYLGSTANSHLSPSAYVFLANEYEEWLMRF